ncbi:hypothetical protein ACWOE3_07725 [Enterococcus dispar]|uniref:Uncharacterized protein n=1 Tax=Enterococcus dispar ATCC 51266 TaxID=1139219 RepID=S0KGG5_9ENTE|nr:hypothetical protein [Enterococcus dispar]EOT43884.1 hypothetical protein OMK_00026 [Enterococcus dispar ATCC 51266]EOW85858.1 hypothetical protein I569_01175 [Enterococcus dispar ATCC 51266]
MSILVPTNMTEVAEKLNEDKNRGIETTQRAIILQAVLDNAQDILNGALEGPYWKVKWGKEDESLIIYDIMNQEVGTVTAADSFIENFRNNPASVIRSLDDQIQKIVKNA